MKSLGPRQWYKVRPWRNSIITLLMDGARIRGEILRILIPRCMPGGESQIDLELSRLVKDGEIERVQKGVYRMPAKQTDPSRTWIPARTHDADITGHVMEIEGLDFQYLTLPPIAKK